MEKTLAAIASLLLVVSFATPAQSAPLKYLVYQRTLSAFSSTATSLTSQQKAQVKAAVDANPTAEKFICTGIRYYSQPMSVNIMVRKRAKAACEYAKQLNPELSTWYQNKPTKARSYAGKVLLTVKTSTGYVEPDVDNLPKDNLTPCRLLHLRDAGEQIRVGFPKAASMDVPDGKLVVQLIYVDFPNLASETSPRDDVSAFADEVRSYIDAMTNGKVSIEWRFENEYFRMENDVEDYNLSGGRSLYSFVPEVIKISDSKINFSDIDVIIPVLPDTVKLEQASVAWAAPAGEFPTSEKLITKSTLVQYSVRQNSFILAHEIGHLLGLVDLYAYDSNQFEKLFRFTGQFDIMSHATGPSKEWLAWSRWSLGYLEDEKVACIDGEDVSRVLELSPGSALSSGLELAIIPTSPTTGIAIESRRNIRFDSDAEEVSNGLLVYSIDTSIAGGMGPIQVIGRATSSDALFSDAPLKEGENLVIGGFKISNLSSSLLKDTAKIQSAD